MNSQVNPLYKYDKVLSEAQQRMSTVGIVRTCLNCEHSCTVSNTCLKYGICPPMHVIAIGCEIWELEIPF